MNPLKCRYCGKRISEIEAIQTSPVVLCLECYRALNGGHTRVRYSVSYAVR
ncbi:MAG: hypothetical protein H0Z28_10160 [Archaeoglobus sp.]|nr:hypothetical protein [Archaeoglobus sp.]